LPPPEPAAVAPPPPPDVDNKLSKDEMSVKYQLLNQFGLDLLNDIFNLC
jgi:hypothetical protein